MTTITSGNIPSGRGDVGWEDMTSNYRFGFTAVQAKWNLRSKRSYGLTDSMGRSPIIADLSDAN